MKFTNLKFEVKGALCSLWAWLNEHFCWAFTDADRDGNQDLYHDIDFSFADLAWALPDSSIPDLHLSRFAAEDEGRTEEPTERRLREEREKGRVPKSQDLVSAIVLLGSIAGLYFAGGYMMNSLLELFHRLIGEGAALQNNFGQEDVRALTGLIFTQTIKICAPLFGIAMFMGVVGNVAQVGGMFSTKPLFMPERLTPNPGKILPNRRTLYTLLKTFVMVAIVGSAAYMVVVDDFIPMLKSSGMDTRQALVLFGHSAFKLLIICGVLLLLIAIPDYFFERYEYRESLKMDVSEVKRERKEDFGDPLIRQRQRERHMQLLKQRNMLKDVPTADVVITNPTHYAVALLYDMSISSAPRVVAKGQNWLALEIRRIARENDVPIEESPELARTLYKTVEIGRDIPEDLYRAVSLILRGLERFRRKIGI